MPIRALGIAVFVLLGLASIGSACRYSVRDVGFVDLGDSPYWLFIYVPADREPDLEKEDVFASVHAELMDANVLGGILFVDEAPLPTPRDPANGRPATVRFPRSETGHPGDEEIRGQAEALLNRQTDISFPIGILLAADGRARTITADEDPSEESTQTLATSIRSIAQTATASPLRERLANEILNVHSIVLLLEGPRTDANRAAEAMATQAVERIESTLGTLPKAITHPPKLISVSRQESASEKILLWSLGLPETELAEPHFVVLYGRLRRMGPPQAVPGTTWLDLAELLYWIGLDCECEMDRSLMRGVMAPHVWDRRLEAKAAEQLGFDPGHPFVKAEVSRIVHRGMGQGMAPSGPAPSRPAFDLGGYTEIEIEPLVDLAAGPDTQSAVPATDPGRADPVATSDIPPKETAPVLDAPSRSPSPIPRPSGPGTPAGNPSRSEEPSGQEFGSPSQAVFWTTGILALLVLGLSAIVVLRARWRS